MRTELFIGTVRLANRTVLAPLAGITDLPLRLLARERGAALVYTEMVSANGLLHESAKTGRLLDSHPSERPLAAQIFGADPEIVADAARMVADTGADIIDINFGCSVKKIVKTGSGVALMKDPGRAARLLEAVRRAVSIPLTIKLRSGWDPSGDQALAIARIAADAGVDAIALHPRTARQGFSGSADWSLIARLKRAVAVPVIGNGDVTAPADAIRMREITGCDAVMIGRAAAGSPWIFSQVLELADGRPPSPVTTEDRRAVMHRYLDAAVDRMGEAVACRMMRSRLGWFVKGLPHAATFRESIKHLSSHAEAAARIDRYLTSASSE